MPFPIRDTAFLAALLGSVSSAVAAGAGRPVLVVGDPPGS
jgi:nucleotide-binding universal stress UspA family protein